MNIQFIKLCPHLVSDNVKNHHDVTRIVRPAARLFEYCYLRIQTILNRISAYWTYGLNVWTDRQVAQQMMIHVKQETFLKITQNLHNLYNFIVIYFCFRDTSPH